MYKSEIEKEKVGKWDCAKDGRIEFFYQDSVHTMPAHFENGEKCDG